MKVTNEQLLKFYARPEISNRKEYPITQAYKEAGHWPSGDYSNLADAFSGKGSDEDRKFYCWFSNRIECPESLLSLKELMEKDSSFSEFMKNPDKESVLIEKWHLYVSYYALEEYWEEKGIEYISVRGKKKYVKPQWLRENISADVKDNPSGILHATACNALLIWMYEAADWEKKAEDLNSLRNDKINGILDGNKIWISLSGGSPKRLRCKIYNLIASSTMN